MCFYYQTIKTPIGKMTAVVNQTALVSLSFTDSNDYQTALQKLRKQAPLKQTSHHPIINQIAIELEGYFHGYLKTFSTPFEFVIGTPFQQRVWQALSQLNYGQTVTYGDVAHMIEKPKSVRAVSTAIGQNPLSIIIPCHRVVRKDGRLGGFNSGLHRKSILINLEAMNHDSTTSF